MLAVPLLREKNRCFWYHSYFSEEVGTESLESYLSLFDRENNGVSDEKYDFAL